MARVILKLLERYPSEQLGTMGLEMREVLSLRAEGDVLLDFVGVLLGAAQLNPQITVEPMVVGVDHAHGMLLVVGIEDLEHILADKLIVAI